MTVLALTQRMRLVCRGVVQGVGFRPAVYRAATSLGLSGFVRNTPDGVVIEVEGAAAAQFREHFTASLPPLARITELDITPIPPQGDTVFIVLESEQGPRERALVPPDVAICSSCRADMEESGGRRFCYPFTTCTDCGPRFSLVRSLPYDRERTTMACFPLCHDCQSEYEEISDRRFHAEPIACPICGPKLWLVDSKGCTIAKEHAAITMAQEKLADGAIVAIKGLGGFQLACRADDSNVIFRLRERKNRPAKPFAIMVGNLSTAERYVELDDKSRNIMISPQSPVILARRKENANLSDEIAPELDDLGILLPTTPLHVELFRNASFPALIMTSGNASDEPICRGNREALQRLSTIADFFLFHDRDVARRVDDSVVRSSSNGAFVVRRARGFVPATLPLPVKIDKPILALGPYLQNTACLAVQGEAFCSQHVGDLDNEAARAFLTEVVEQLEEFLQVRGETIVVDAHPDYPSTWLGERLAKERDGRLLQVQHHLAHAAATLAEHGRFPKVNETVGAIILDGTGWGTDGTAWGGEWLLLDGNLNWRRAARLQPLPLVGGESAVREPWRVLVAALVHEGAEDLVSRLPISKVVGGEKMASVARLAQTPGWPTASGAGRVFEAAGALLAGVVANGYEGEAAARLESLAAEISEQLEPWPEVVLKENPATFAELPTGQLLLAAARRFLGGEMAALVAAGFHATFCRLVGDMSIRVFTGHTRVVALGGGCLVNRIVRHHLSSQLLMHGLEPLLPQQLPPGDGGISYGQAVLGAVTLARGSAPLENGGIRCA